jgi:hypothetical protein
VKHTENSTLVTIKHSKHDPIVDRSVPENYVTKIKELTAVGVKPASINCELSKAIDKEEIKYFPIKQDQIRYHYNKETEKLWKLDQDGLVSAKKAIDANENSKKLDLNSPVDHVCFVTDFTSDKFKVDTSNIFVDSTYGTENSKKELFVMLGTFNGEGYPLSYLYVDKIKDKGQLKQILIRWFTALKDSYSVWPTFFSCDKCLAEVQFMNDYRLMLLKLSGMQ